MLSLRCPDLPRTGVDRGSACDLPLSRTGTCPVHGRSRLDIRAGKAGAGAIFSADGLYRYALWRTLAQEELFVRLEWAAFCGLNPSDADADDDDATIRVCTEYGKRWGLAGFFMVNTCALVETDRLKMLRHPAPVGVDNDYVLERVARSVNQVIACWGADAQRARANAVTRIFMQANRPLHVLHLNKDGSPHHPLYLKSDLVPVPWIQALPFDVGR